MAISLPEPDDRHRWVRQVKLYDQGPEDHVAEQNAHEARRRCLDARAVIGLQPPSVKGNVKRRRAFAVADGQLEREPTRLVVQRVGKEECDELAQRLLTQDA